jgi:leucyl-tRNA synthetase
MSKSRYNVVNPDDVVKATARTHCASMKCSWGRSIARSPGPTRACRACPLPPPRLGALHRGTDGLRSSRRIVESWRRRRHLKALHKTIKAVTHDIEHLLFNTAIARMMEFVNAALKAEKINRAVMEQFVLVLAPFAPHMAEEIWQRLGHAETLAYAAWPKHDESLLTEDTIEIPVQVNGKLRATVQVPTDAPMRPRSSRLRRPTSASRPSLTGKELVKEIYVPNKMVNFVVKG